MIRYMGGGGRARVWLGTGGCGGRGGGGGGEGEGSCSRLTEVDGVHPLILPRAVQKGEKQGRWRLDIKRIRELVQA